jgi:hypothetical protein
MRHNNYCPECGKLLFETYSRIFGDLVKSRHKNLVVEDPDLCQCGEKSKIMTGDFKKRGK